MSFPHELDEADSLQLVARMQAGDRSAAGQVYRRYRDELLLAVRAGMGPGLRAAFESEDVLQSVALEAISDLRSFVPRGPGSLRAFLVRIVQHKLVDRARALTAKKRRGSVALTESVAEAVPEHPPVEYDDSRYAELERALLALPDELREIVKLRRFDGLSSKEIAERTGRTDAAVRKQFSRAMARLTLLMGGRGS